jgi:hypothetical protein
MTSKWECSACLCVTPVNLGFCLHCGSKSMHKKVYGPDIGKYIKKASLRQEKTAEKRYGAKRQPASGAMSSAKGDLRDAGRLRLECKTTQNKSFTLKVEELEKIGHEASRGEIPVFEIEFCNTSHKQRYVVLPYWAYDVLMTESNYGKTNSNNCRPGGRQTKQPTASELLPESGDST